MSHEPVRVYRAQPPGEDFLVKLTVHVPDRPGSLAQLAGALARHGANITFFHYNRSEDTNRVSLEATASSAEACGDISRDLDTLGFLARGEEHPVPPLGIVDTGNILRLDVTLEHRPGALARFASLLRDHGANVISMDFNDDVSSTTASVSLVTGGVAEIDRLLREMNDKNLPYAIHYRGAGQKEADDIIGLNLVERFFIRLRGILGTDDLARLRRVVESSRGMSAALVRFTREAGKHLEAGEVFGRVLAFASASLSRTGRCFSCRRLPPLARGPVTLHAFRLPTGGNLFLLQGGAELVMIDGGYGLYFEDVKRMLRANGFDPAAIGRIYVTHPDADHAGLAAPFVEEFGSRVFFHPRAQGVFSSENRAWDSGSPLEDLNLFFTILVNEFTGFRVPRAWTPFGGAEAGREGDFRVIDRFEIGRQSYDVLESRGGHAAGQVFFLGREAGMLFTGDFLLSIDSLSRGERDILDLPKFMMTSTNADSRLFRQEMESLRRLALSAAGEGMTVVPGHGDYYPAAALA